MPYADEQALIKAAGGLERWRQIAYRDDGTAVDLDKLDTALRAGDNLITRHLGPTFRLPIEDEGDTYDVLKQLAAEEGVYTLLKYAGALTQAEIEDAVRRTEALVDMRKSKQWPGRELPQGPRAETSRFVSGEEIQAGFTRGTLRKGFVR